MGAANRSGTSRGSKTEKLQAACSLINKATDEILAVRALEFWANNIETNNVMYTAEDLAAAGFNAKIITPEQASIIARLRVAAKNLRKAQRK